MKRVKRMEIVVDTLAVPEVLGALEASGLSGWTVVRDVTGKGERGLRAGDELTGVAGNGYILTVCEPEELARRADAGQARAWRALGFPCVLKPARTATPPPSPLQPAAPLACWRRRRWIRGSTVRPADSTGD